MAFVVCGNFNENLQTTQDYELWFRLAERYQFIHVPQPLVKARSHLGQGSLRLANLARAECEKLLSGFVLSLSKHELCVATGKSVAESYVALAANMWSRGFRASGWVAAWRSLSTLFSSPYFGANALVRLIGEFLRWYVTTPLRNRISAAVRVLH